MVEAEQSLVGLKLGFAGLGEMGAPMARNLLAAGATLKVWNRTAARTAELERLGAQPVRSPRELGNGDVVVTMVSDGPDVADVVLGEEGVFAGAASGLLWIDCSSISPSAAVELAAAAREHGVEPVDAPVSGGTRGAHEASLSIMVGAGESGFRQAAPILAALGSNITHVGPNGAGQVAKLVNQMIVGGTIALVSEGFLLATAAGCSPAAVRDALAGGFADSRVLQAHGQRMLDDAFEPGFRSSLQLKDLRNAVDSANAAGVPAPVTALVQQLFSALCATGRAENDHASLFQLYHQLAGRTAA